MDHFLNGTAIKRFRMVWLVIPYWIAIYGVLLWKSEKNDLRSAIFSDAGSLYQILTLLLGSTSQRVRPVCSCVIYELSE